MNELHGYHWRLLIGDCRESLRGLPDKSVHVCCTSPPYWGLRAYETNGHAAEIGRESTVDEYVANIVAAFQAVRRVLRDDGTVYLNLGDSYAGSWGNAGRRPELDETTDNQRPKDATYLPRGGWDENRARPPQSYMQQDAGNQVLVPHRVAIAMQADGWCLRDTLIWSKKSPMPQSIAGWRWMKCMVKVQKRSAGKRYDGVIPTSHHPGQVAHRDGSFSKPTDGKWADCPGCEKCRDTGGYVLKRGSWRRTTAHEYVFVFTKGMKYYSDSEVAQEKAVGGTPGNKRHKGADAYASGDKHMRTKAGLVNMTAVQQRNPRSVIQLSSDPSKVKHFAAFPRELVRRLLVGSIGGSGRCCAACGTQYAPVVLKERIATRPGEETKVTGDSKAEGNRDPQRHVTASRVLDYLPACKCGTAEYVRPTVIDPFCGTGTTGQVAMYLGCDFIGCELSETYANKIASRRLSTAWAPKPKVKTKGVKKHKPVAGQRFLF